MKQTTKITLCALSFIVLLSGCYHTPKRVQRRERQQPPQVDNYTKNAVKNHDKKISELTFQLKHINGNNNKLTREINKLIKSNASLQQQVNILKKDINMVGNALDTERNNRHSETETLLKEVAKQTTSAINAQKAQQVQQEKLRIKQLENKKGPATEGNFYEYKVQSGATLGAIAKAYKVSVNDIKKANRLKNDNIRVGQKLYIPKK